MPSIRSWLSSAFIQDGNLCSTKKMYIVTGILTSESRQSRNRDAGANIFERQLL